MTKKKLEGATFEQGMERLEEIVQQMELAELPLDEIIQKYEEGMHWIAQCEAKLKAAEQKIALITRTRSGEVAISSLDPQREPANSNPQGDDGEVSLL